MFYSYFNIYVCNLQQFKKIIDKRVMWWYNACIYFKCDEGIIF